MKKDYVPEINKPDIATSLDGLYKMQNYLEDAQTIVSQIPESAKQVLDVGCGTGRLAPFIQTRGIAYVGVDQADLLLEKAQKNCPTLKFLQMSVLDLHFPDESFDAVLCINVLKHLHRHEVEKAFSELVRVCRLGGTIIIRVPVIPETRSYTEYNVYITAQGLQYEDIAFHWSDIFQLASQMGLTLTYPEIFLTSKEPYLAPIIVFSKE